MFKNMNEILQYIGEGNLRAKDVRDDLWEGRCRVVAAGRRGKPLSVEYPDGRRFDLIGGRYYTAEALAVLIMMGYAMSSDNPAGSRRRSRHE